MGIFAFVKEAGEKLWESIVGQEAQAAESLKDHIAKVGLGNPNIQVSVEGDKVIATGEVASQEEKEKILLALGNVAGVSGVEDHITVATPAAEARFVTVEEGRYAQRHRQGGVRQRQPLQQDFRGEQADAQSSGQDISRPGAADSGVMSPSPAQCRARCFCAPHKPSSSAR